MIKTENLLASLKVEIPAIEENSEGQLKGGFSFFESSDVDLLDNGNCGNCICSEDNDDCGNCYCPVLNSSCPGKPTKA